MVLGPALGGLLVGIGGVRTALLLDTSTFVLATLAAVRVQHRRQVTPAGGRVRFRSGVTVIAADPVLLGSASTPSVALLIPWTVLGGLGNAVLNTCVGTLLALRVPDEVRGRVAAAVGGLVSGGLLLSMLGGGLLTSLLDPRQVFGLCALVGLAAPVLLGRRLLAVEGDREPAVFEQTRPANRVWRHARSGSGA